MAWHEATRWRWKLCSIVGLVDLVCLSLLSPLLYLDWCRSASLALAALLATMVLLGRRTFEKRIPQGEDYMECSLYFTRGVIYEDGIVYLSWLGSPYREVYGPCFWLHEMRLTYDIRKWKKERERQELLKQKRAEQARILLLSSTADDNQ
jgi:hypothetical protein